jgi:hypothetical protein
MILYCDTVRTGMPVIDQKIHGRQAWPGFALPVLAFQSRTTFTSTPRRFAPLSAPATLQVR